MTDVFLMGVLGTIIGSFLNVLIDRLPKEENVITGRSRCDDCRTVLQWYDLIPIVSFLVLRGKCRYCKKKLSVQYPAIEGITGIVYSAVWLIDMPQVARVHLLSLLSGSIVIAVSDIKYRVIPDAIIVFHLLSSGLYLWFSAPASLPSNLLSGLLLLLFFLTVVGCTRGKGMGWGDVKYSFFMGFLLGFPKTIVAFYLSFLTGALVSLILVATGRKTLKSSLPFGPFLIFATLLAFFWGSKIWEWVIGNIIGI